MKKYIWQILLAAVLSLLLFSCNGSKVISGKVTDVNGKRVKVAGRWFYVPENTPVLNQYCTFTGTKDSTKVTSILITNK